VAAPAFSRETERKLVPPDGFDIEALGEPAERGFTSAYWDTAGGTLRLAGLTLRRRTENRRSVWQLKLPGRGSRTEVEVPGGTAVPPALADALAAHVAVGGALREVARLRTARRAVPVTTKHGRVEVALDTVDVLEGRRRKARFSEVELELLEGDERALRTLAKRIDGEPAPTATKLDRALGPHPDDERSRLARLFDAQLRALLAHDPGARLGAHPEDVHQLRVALRRTLAILRGAAPWIDETWAEQLRVESTRLLKALGPARDADVFHLWLLDQAEQLDGDGRALVRLDARLAQQRADAHANAQAELEDERTRTLLFLLATPRVAEEEPRFRPLARSETARLRKLAHKAGRRPDDELLHRLRLRGKRTRYALELAAPELGRRGRDALDAARQLQDVLGEHQDAVVAEERLRDLARSARGGTAIALGRLVEHQHVRRHEARRRFEPAWERFEGAAKKL
jgi:CHAD domain-containing protein